MGINSHERLYEEAAATFGAALGRLARAYEADPEKRRDLLQEIHLALWRSFEGFDGRCSLRTWSTPRWWTIDRKKVRKDPRRASNASGARHRAMKAS